MCIYIYIYIYIYMYTTSAVMLNQAVPLRSHTLPYLGTLGPRRWKKSVFASLLPNFGSKCGVPLPGALLGHRTGKMKGPASEKCLGLPAPLGSLEHLPPLPEPSYIYCQTIIQ